jgi:hypothetical protein
MLTADELAILRKPEVQEYIREKWNGKVRFCEQYLFQGFINHCLCQEGRKITPNMILIPDCISRDSSRPERGLWGCLKPFISGGMNYYPYVDATAMSDQVMVGFRCGCASIMHWIGTPRLALLKALEWQIGRTREEVMKTREDLAEKIRLVLNCASREGCSDTPDFILAEYMLSALECFETACRDREKWYGRQVKDINGEL